MHEGGGRWVGSNKLVEPKKKKKFKNNFEVFIAIWFYFSVFVYTFPFSHFLIQCFVPFLSFPLISSVILETCFSYDFQLSYLLFLPKESL